MWRKKACRVRSGCREEKNCSSPALKACSRSAPTYIRHCLPFGPAGRRRPPTRTRSAAPRGCAAARRRNPPATLPLAVRSRPATGSARPCPTERSVAPGNRRPTLRASKEPVTARRDSLSAALISAGSPRKNGFSSVPTSPRSRSLARRTSTGPTPVWIVRCGPWP
jgi:hypothetical protein